MDNSAKGNKRLNSTYTKLQTRSKLAKRSSGKESNIHVDRSNKLKNIGLTEYQWKIYQVNALWEFSYETSDLHKYEAILEKYVEKAVLEDSAIAVNYTFELSVAFKPLHDISFTEIDNPAIKVTVTGKINGETTDEYVECFSGLLLSIGRKEGTMENQRLEKKAVILPLFLAAYEKEAYLQSFIAFLEGNFSCTVNPLKFSSTDLKFILTMLSSPEEGIKPCATVLEYDLQLEELNVIEYIIDANSIANAWKKVIGTREINEDTVNEFLSVLENHFYEIFHIKLSDLQLSGIRTPIGKIHGKSIPHWIKVDESSMLYSFMMYLTNLAQGACEQ